MRQNLDAVSIVVICRQRHGGVSQQGMLLFEIALTGFLKEEGRLSGENLRHTHSHLQIERTDFCRIYQNEYAIFNYGKFLPSRQTIP